MEQQWSKQWGNFQSKNRANFFDKMTNYNTPIKPFEANCSHLSVVILTIELD